MKLRKIARKYRELAVGVDADVVTGMTHLPKRVRLRGALVDVAVQEALDEQRERIAANLDKLAKINERNGGGTIAAIMYHVAAAIRRGEIGGGQK